jgi:hypothetical protein
MSNRWRICLAAALLSLSAVRTSAAQTWVGEKGEASLELESSYQWADKTFEGDLRITGVPAQSLRNSIGVGYVPISRLLLEGSIVLYQLDRYTGPQMGAPGVLLAHGDNDDGDWHGTVSDAQLGVRYQLLEGDFAVTPLLRVKFPASDYEERGYAATGNGLIEVAGGFYVGKLGLFHERVFAQAGYLFTWVQKQDQGGELTEEYSTHNSSAHADAGALLGDEWTVSLMTDFLWTHGGFNLVDIAEAPEPVFEWHDSILQRKFISIGAAVGYDVAESLRLNLAGALVLWGDNVSNARTVTLGLDWTFLSGGG